MDQANERDIEPLKPPRFVGWLPQFANTNAGVVILGFLLTTILGGLFTWGQKYVEDTRRQGDIAAEKRREEDSRIAQYNIRQDHEVRDLVDNAVVQRAVYADDLVRAFERGARIDELKADWLRYQTSRHDFVAAKLRNMMNLKLEFAPGSYPDDLRSSMFWEYLDFVIRPAFDAFDRCIADSYGRASAEADSQSAAPKRVFEGCGVEPDNFTQQFSRKSLDDVNRQENPGYAKDHPRDAVDYSVSRWDQFVICVQEYAFFIDMTLRKKEQALDGKGEDLFAKDPNQIKYGLLADCGDVKGIRASVYRHAARN